MTVSSSTRAKHSRASLPWRAARRLVLIACAILFSTSFTSCDSRVETSETTSANAGSNSSIPAPNSGEVAPILLFSGTGTSPNDVTAFETILKANRLDYSKADSSQLNETSESELRRYRLLIVPGGNFVEMGNHLTSNTVANVRNAVHNGLNYLGVCAGGFLAGSFGGGYNSFNLSSGVKFNFYSAESQGIRKAAVPISSSGGPTLDQYWEDGPQFTGWGSIVAKYPDGTPAIVENAVGSGWVILTGVHPEAPEDWRRGMTFKTPASEDNAYATTLVRAALNRTSLSHY